MVTKVADLQAPPNRAMLDTNVLLTATAEDRPAHEEALRIFNDWPDSGTVLYTSGQIMREYLVVTTRPVGENGLGLNSAEALGNVRAFRRRTKLLAETARITDRLLVLLEDVACVGKLVHDANVVATMLAHGVDTIVTGNVRDFARFGQFIRVLSL